MGEGPIMERDKLVTLVCATVADVLGLAPDEVTCDTDLLAELQVDSLELMEVGARLETALGRRIDARELSEVTTVNQAVDILTATGMPS
jgi:acyl carrier protein